MSEMTDAIGRAQMLTQAISHARLALCLTDPGLPDNPIVYANTAFLELTGYDESEVIGRNCRFLQGPDTDRRAVDRLRKALDERSVTIVDLLNYRKDGSAFVNAVQVGPIYDSAGRLSYFFGSQLDVTADRAAEAKARQLADAELQHRLTNIISVLCVLVRLTAREQLDARAQAQRIIERITALGEAHINTLARGEKRADLGTLAHSVLRAYAPRGEQSFQLEGPAIALGIANISPFVLLLHELAANAVKHGALSQPEGKVTLTWTTRPGAEAPADNATGKPGRARSGTVLTLTWQESGGGPVVAPSSTHGLRIAAELLASAHGRFDCEWQPQGLIAQVQLPLLGSS